MIKQHISGDSLYLESYHDSGSFLHNLKYSGLYYKKSWALNNWCFWTVVLEKTLESPLDCKEIQPVHSKGDQSWVFIGRTAAEAEIPILWPPDVKKWLIGKDPDAGRDWGQEEKGVTEDEMAGCYHWLDGHEFELTLGVVWVNSGRPGMLWFMGSQIVGHDWVTELNWKWNGLYSIMLSVECKDSQARSLFSPRTDFETVWGAARFCHYLDSAL